jgi:hypothetical protein
LDFSVRYLRSGEALTRGDEAILNATIFPHSAVKIQFVKPEWEWSYIEAGIRIRYSHVSHIPADAVAVLIWAKLFHRKGDDDFYSTQRVLLIDAGKLSPMPTLSPTLTSAA